MARMRAQDGSIWNFKESRKPRANLEDVATLYQADRNLRDIVSHNVQREGLRERYMDPSSPQQAGFHEGFADGHTAT